MTSIAATTRPGQKAPILPLTSVRIFAALYVVLLHGYFWTHHLWVTNWFGRFVRNGYTAVGFFFSLSAFILAHVYLNTDRPFNRRAFWTSRFARAYPLLFISLLLDAPRDFRLTAHLHGALTAVVATSVALVSEALLLQSWSPLFRNLNSPSWSLSDEAFFYLLFPIFAVWVWRARRWHSLLVFFALWGCAMLTPVLITHHNPALFVETGTAPELAVELMPIFRIFEFLAGVAICAFQATVIAPLPESTRSRLASAALLAAAIYFILSIQFSTHIPLLVMSNGFLLPTYALTILGLVNIRGPIERLFSHHQFVLWGEASYAVYLLHSPIYLILFALHPLDSPALWILYIALVLTCSLLSFLYLERPIRKWILARAAVRPPVTLAQETVAPS